MNHGAGDAGSHRVGAPRLGPVVVARPRLLAALLGPRAPLTVVRGPAGCGKSTLVAQWLAQEPPEGVVLWHTRDDPVGTRSSYWIDLIEDLARHRLISRPSAQHWNQSLLQSQYTRRAVRGALEEVGAPITLVLENFGPPGSHWDAVASDIVGLLEAMPTVSVVAIGRAPTPLEDVAAAITVGSTLVLGDELLLEPDEARDVASARGLGDIEDSALAELLASSERLMLPFQFALESVRRAAGAAPVANESWLDGYSRELVRRLESEGLLEFAGMVAQAPYATAELVDATTDTHDSGSVLAALEQAGVGTISIDHEGEEVFRFTGHARPLIGDAFRAAHPDTAKRIQARVAHWLAGRGSMVSAIEYAIRGDDLDFASTLLARHFTEISAEQGEQLIELVGELDRTRMRRYPTISMAFALMLNARAETRVAAADYFVATAAEAHGGAKHSSVVERFLLAGQEAAALRVLGRVRAATQAAHRMVDIDDELTNAERVELGMTYPQIVSHSAITFLYAHDLAAARRGFERELEWSLREDFGGRVNTALGALAFVETVSGRIHDAEAHLARQRSLDWPPGWDDGHPGVFTVLARAAVLRNRGDSVAAIAELDGLDRHFATIEHWGYIAAQRALTVAADGAPTLALTEFDGVLSTRGERASRAILEAFNVDSTREYLAALAGEPSRVAQGEARGRSDAVPLSIRAVREALAGRVHRAAELLARADLASDSVAGDLYVATAGVVVTRRSSDQAGSIRPFAARIGGLVAANGLTTPLALLPEEDRIAVLAEVERDDQAEVLGRVFERFTAHSVGPGSVIDLSARERAVLQALVSTGSRAELASRLFVSVNTVKTQLRTLYRKLGVGDRDAALLRAVELRLLDLQTGRLEFGGESDGSEKSVGRPVL